MRNLPTYETIFGFSITADAGMDTSRKASGEVATFLHAIKTASIVVDVGANVGFFTLLAAKHHVPVLAVEPSAANLEVLLRNVQRESPNFDVPIEVYPVALGAEPGVHTLFGAGQGASLVRGWGGIRNTRGRLTPVTTIDRLLSSRLRDEVAVIKLDVEGYEFDVLKGSEGVLSLEPSPVWIVEHGVSQNFPSGVNPHFRDLFELFWRAGYRGYTIEGHLVSRSDVDVWVQQGKIGSKDINFIFRR
jgi:FkbM family methyltransferase